MKVVAVMVVIMLLGQTSYSSARAHCVGDKVSIAENDVTYYRMGCAYAKCANKPNLIQVFGVRVFVCILNSCSNICTEKH
ncbi:hypothetical protein MKX03_033109 [Papaver bracteatum]|nr:hypothetical protein MKX03_033109 [Papaver bracteatum]